MEWYLLQLICFRVVQLFHFAVASWEFENCLVETISKIPLGVNYLINSLISRRAWLYSWFLCYDYSSVSVWWAIEVMDFALFYIDYCRCNSCNKPVGGCVDMYMLQIFMCNDIIASHFSAVDSSSLEYCPLYCDLSFVMLQQSSSLLLQRYDSYMFDLHNFLPIHIIFQFDFCIHYKLALIRYYCLSLPITEKMSCKFNKLQQVMCDDRYVCMYRKLLCPNKCCWVLN